MYYLTFIEKNNTSDANDNGPFTLKLIDEKNKYYTNGDVAGAFTVRSLGSNNYIKTISKALTNSDSLLIN